MDGLQKTVEQLTAESAKEKLTADSLASAVEVLVRSCTAAFASDLGIPI